MDVTRIWTAVAKTHSPPKKTTDVVDKLAKLIHIFTYHICGLPFLRSSISGANMVL